MLVGRPLLPLLLAASFLIPTLQVGTPSPDEAAIREARLAQNRAIASHDIDSASTFWVEGVSVTAGLGTTLQGRDAYKQAFAHDSSFRYDRLPSKIVVSGNWPLAWEEGSWSGFRKGFASPVIQGTYSAMWVKDSAHWRIRSELFVALTCASKACGWPVSTGPE